LHVSDAAETREHLQLKKQGVFSPQRVRRSLQGGAASCRTLVGAVSMRDVGDPPRVFAAMNDARASSSLHSARMGPSIKKVAPDQSESGQSTFISDGVHRRAWDSGCTGGA
jgi:hypothetical protein